MSETLHSFIEQYGLVAIFVGCLAEGESAAVLAGFFAHQGVFALSGALAATFLGAFLGDAAIFIAGRRFSKHDRVRRLTQRPGFDRALHLVGQHPTIYVLLNRYIYGFRLVGGVAAGLSAIPVLQFLALNALSSAIWATLFVAFGYVFGAGAEQILGVALAKHERLLIGLALCASVAIAAAIVAHFLVRNVHASSQHAEASKKGAD